MIQHTIANGQVITGNFSNSDYEKTKLSAKFQVWANEFAGTTDAESLCGYLNSYEKAQFYGFDKVECDELVKACFEKIKACEIPMPTTFDDNTVIYKKDKK